MTINFRRAVYKYATGETAVSYIAASDFYQNGVPQFTRYAITGPLDAANNVFPNDAAAIAYYDGILPALAVADYNTAFSASETVGLLFEFNPEIVRTQFAAVDVAVASAAGTAGDALAAAASTASDLSDIQDELAGITADISGALSLSDIQTGVTLADVATDLPTNISVVALLGSVIGNVNATNVRVNLLATRLNSLITALESKSILTP